jgi:hypothetical protein
MMDKKPYSPVAPYAELKRVENEMNAAESVDKIRQLVAKDGPKVGYKAFCYMLSGKMTPEGMKADEACVAAAVLEQQGKLDEAMEIYRRVVAVYPDHPLAKSRLG